MSDAPRILVVDDTEANRYAVVRHLRKAGYLALEALDGRRALESTLESSPTWSCSISACRRWTGSR